MLPRVENVIHIEQYRLCIIFTNGESAEIDFRDKIVGRGGVFSDLENIDFFKSVKVDPDFGTLVWPNEADFCPDALYCEATGKNPLEEFGYKV